MTALPTAWPFRDQDIFNAPKETRNVSAAIHLETITTRLPELESLWTHKTEAAESYTNAVQIVAVQAGVEPGALKTYIAAKMRDKLEKLERESEQLSLMLETF